MKQQNLHKLAAMKTHTMGTVTAALLLIGSVLVVQADDKKEAKDPLTEKYAAKEKEIGAALKSGLISKEIADRILKEYERQLKADQRRGQFRNRQAGGAIGDARARADKAREDARARMEEKRKNQGLAGGARLDARARAGRDGRNNRGQAFDPFARQRLGGFNRRDPFKNLDLTEEQQKAIAAIQQKKSEELLEYKEMIKELEEGYINRMEAVLTDEQKAKYKEMQTQRNQRFQPRRPADR